MRKNISHMNALDLRKQLLIAESEVNRVRLAAANSGFNTMFHGVATVGAIASSAAILATNLAAIPRKPQTGGPKSWCLQTTLYGAVLISSAWLALIPRKG